MESRSAHYSSLQIALHWLVVALVLFQLVFGEEMAHVFDAMRRGQTPAPGEARWANFHIWVGFSVLAAVLLRLGLRFQNPPRPEAGNRVLARLAWAVHVAFYVLLIALPISGGIAYYFEVPALAELHELGKPILIALIALHVLAALWHQFVRRDGLLMRMLVPR